MNRKFSKNDDNFIRIKCGSKVDKLNYTSRDHCNKCLCSLHLDINPVDRKNECKGIMKPVDIENNSKKVYVIIYRCQKCGATHKNKAALDDNIDTIISVMNKTYDKHIEKIVLKREED